MVEKLEMKTARMSQENIEKIRALFPNAVTEVKKDGKIELAVDFDVLKQELSDTVIEAGQERYQMTWPDKRKAVALANSAISATLRPCKEESVDFDTTENLYIEGDNLDVLKLLRETYLGKVKMIYIDPPYNTGNDFVYEDDFAQSAEEYTANSGQYDEQGNRLFQNTESNGRFHTDWLNMIYPRLKVARDLLTDDGVIFISIDDNEQANLKKICDEVFGESNFVAQLIWKKKAGGANDATDIAVEHEYVMCYKKYLNGIGKIPLNEERIKEYKYSDEKEETHGKYTIKNLNDKSLQDSKGLHFDITCPDGNILKGEDNQWKCNKETFEARLKDNRIVFIKKSNGEWTCNYKIYLNEEKGQLKYDEYGNIIKKGRNLSSLITNVLNRDGNDEIKALFSGYPFSYPKPSLLIKQLLVCGTTKNAIVLDFFSGSATTAHAVMQLNAEDGGNRKFIMVQLPEKCDEKSEAYKAGYKNICEIGKERIRRAGKKIKEESPLTTQDLDTGFRVLKLDSSNMQDVFYNPSAMTQSLLDATVDNVKPDRTPLDLLFQVMLELGKPLSAKIEEREVDGKKYYAVDGNDLIACFDDDLGNEVITAIAKQKPLYAVFKDKSFATDSVGINNEQLFKTYSPGTVVKVI